jgi:hypothetical protein
MVPVTYREAIAIAYFLAEPKLRLDARLASEESRSPVITLKQ